MSVVQRLLLGAQRAVQCFAVCKAAGLVAYAEKVRLRFALEASGAYIQAGWHAYMLDYHCLLLPTEAATVAVALTLSCSSTTTGCQALLRVFTESPWLF